MPTYKYTAIERGGGKVSGTVDGFNEFDAAARLRETCDVILRIGEVKNEGKSLLSMEIGGNRLDPKAFTVMCSQFAIILRSGIPIARTVHLVADKTNNKTLKRVLDRVALDVEAGRSLSASFADKGGKLFPPTFIETLHAGEESGSMDRAFETMYQHYDKVNKTRSRVRSALAYPIFVLLLAVAVVAVMMYFVVPRFTKLFDEYDAQLPAMTRALVAISGFFQHNAILILAVLIAAIIAYKVYSAAEGGRLRLAKLGLKLPIFGNINQLNAASQFASGMTAMLSAGLPITKALAITAKSLDNYYIRTEVGKLATRLEAGQALASGMAEAKILPDILVDMVAVGEETGEMESTLRTISAYYDAELQEATDSALKKLEPALLVFLAVVAGFVVLSIYMAMFSMYDIL